MNLVKHCELCDNQIIRLKDGTTCKLTGKKPAFNKTCLKIKLNDKFEQKVKEINIEYEQIKKTKASAYIHFSVLLIISVAVIFGGYYIGKYALDSGVISTTPLIIMGAGLSILPVAFGSLNTYRSKIFIAKQKKEKLDNLLSLYNINYTIYVKFGKEIHGTQDVYVILQLKK